MNRTVAIDSEASIFYHIVLGEIGQVAVAFKWTKKRLLFRGNIIVSVDEYRSESLVVHKRPDLRKRQTRGPFQDFVDRLMSTNSWLDLRGSTRESPFAFALQSTIF